MRRPETERRIYDRGPRGFWRRDWIPDRKHPRGGKDKWTFLGHDADAAWKRYDEAGERLKSPLDAPQAETVAAVAKLWLARYVRVVRNEKGHQLATRRVEAFLVPFLGTIEASKLTTDDLMDYRGHLQAYKSKHTGRKLTEQTVAHVLADLKCMTFWAEKRRLMPAGLIGRRFLPKVPERKPRGLSEAEQKAVRKSVPGQAK